jgi:hypothetical protein
VRDWQPEWRGFLAGVATSLSRHAIAWAEPPSARIEVMNLPSSSPFRLQCVSRFKSQLRARERVVDFSGHGVRHGLERAVALSRQGWGEVLCTVGSVDDGSD